MDNEQRAALDSFKRVQRYNTEYATDMATIDDYGDLQDKFDALVVKIDKAGEEQVMARGATPDLMQDLKSEMGRTVIEFASRGSVKAELLGDMELANKLDKAFSFIAFADKETAVQRAKDLRKLLNDNLATLTNVSAANIATIDEAIDGYEGKMNDPIIEIEHRKSQGTELVPGYIKDTNDLLDKMYRLCKSYFNRTKPEMVNEMALAMQIINTGIRHTIVEIKIVDDSGNGLEGVAVSDEKTHKNYLSDFDGVVHIEQHRSGHDSFNIFLSGWQQMKVGMDIKRGIKNSLTVHLVKA